MIARYGFMETPSVPKIFEQCRRKDLNVDISATSFFLSRRSLEGDAEVGDAAAGRSACSSGSRAAPRTRPTYFQIPTDRVVEVGTQVAV